jgi:hypothetical protein
MHIHTVKQKCLHLTGRVRREFPDGIALTNYLLEDAGVQPTICVPDEFTLSNGYNLPANTHDRHTKIRIAIT